MYSTQNTSSFEKHSAKKGSQAHTQHHDFFQICAQRQIEKLWTWNISHLGCKCHECSLSAELFNLTSCDGTFLSLRHFWSPFNKSHDNYVDWCNTKRSPPKRVIGILICFRGSIHIVPISDLPNMGNEAMDRIDQEIGSSAIWQ